jgi:5-methylcytosine-specific restriction endonuclease McrA
MPNFRGKYPASWTKAFRDKFRAARGNKCERCGHPHEPKAGYTLTIHHLDNDKSNCAEWNLAALCQRCHLSIQSRVDMDQGWMLEHTPWMRPHVERMLEWLKKQKRETETRK